MKKNPVLMILVTAAVLGAIFFIILFLGARLSGGRTSTGLPVVGSDRVALVKIEGVLLASDRVVDELHEYAEDSSIKAIVVRIDSPGGGVVPSQEIYNAVKYAKKEGKKVVASMGSVAASGGYYVAAAADKIVANPGTLTGSIGVKMEFANLEKLLEKIGVQGMVVKSGEYKDIGSPFRAMTDTEKKLLQGVIDDVQSQFVTAVATGRNLPEVRCAGHSGRAHLHRPTSAWPQACGPDGRPDRQHSAGRATRRDQGQTERSRKKEKKSVV